MQTSNQYVFTYRNPDSFFEAEEFNLTSRNADILEALKNLHRHDEVTLLGSVLSNTGPVRHISVDDIVTINQYPDTRDYNYTIDETVFDGLTQVKLLANVHAIIDQGKALVLEYQDIILPVLVESPHLSDSASLFRNDKIIADLTMTRSPGRPIHFRTNTQNANAIRTVDSIIDCHNHEKNLTGQLVKFLKSPQINRDVYAVKVTDDNGITRIFTFFPDTQNNDDFVSLFNAISQKAEGIWLNNTATIKNGRNYLINPDITVNVSGRMNITSKSQANPQIYIRDITDLILND